MFKSGEYVLYNCTVCLIKEIVTIHDQNYFVLNPVEDTSLVIKLPVSNADNLLKKIMSKDEALALIKKIPLIKVIENQDHSLENEYKKLMNSGNREDLVKIIKTTYLRNQFRKDNGKKMGEKDSNYFNLAEKALYDEIALSLHKSFGETKDFIINSIRATI
jgi:CarD family transcriptional regulator